jgi:hypothetical protein
VGKALFYSFFAVWRALAAFIVYFLCWMMIVMFAVYVILLLVGKSALGMALTQSLLMVIVMVVQCSVYAAYRSIFGAPGAPEPGDGA